MLRYNDGFDHYGNDASLQLRKWTSCNLSGTARTGTGACRINNNSTIPLEAPMAAGVVAGGFAISLGGNEALSFTSSPGDQFSIFFANSGAVLIRTGNYNGPIVASSVVGVMQSNVYAYVEVGFFNLGATSLIEVRINGGTTPVVSYTGAFSASNIVSWRATNDGTMLLDDYYELDTTGPAPNNTYQGDSACITRLENANGPNQDWAANGDANAYACLGHVPTVPATDYISASTVGDLSDFTVPALPVLTGSVSGIQVFVQSNKSDAGGASIDVGLNSGGTVGNIPTISPGVANMMYTGQIEQDPDTSDFWTVPAANAILPTVERV